MNISSDVIQWCMLNLPPIKDIGFTKPPLAMPEEYKVDDYVLSYRNYYVEGSLLGRIETHRTGF